MTSPDATPLDDLPPGDHRRAHDDPAPAPLSDTEPDHDDTDAASLLHARPDPSLADGTSNAGEDVSPDPRRRVEWVRPMDLITRISARASERGVEWNIRAHMWARTQTRATISEARLDSARTARMITARLTRTGPDPIEQEAARL